MKRSDVLVLTPPGQCDPAMAIAGSRAGATGVLDLELVPATAPWQRAVGQLSANARGQFGIRIGARASHIVEALLSRRPDGLSLVLLAGGGARQQQQDEWIARLAKTGIAVLAEACDLDEALHGIKCGVDGVVLKGSEAGGRIGADSAFMLVQRWRRHWSDSGGAAPDFWVQGGIGLHTAAACAAAGARGVVLSSQLLLARESPLKDVLSGGATDLDGSETTVVGEGTGQTFRVYGRPGNQALETVSQLGRRTAKANGASASAAELAETVARLVGPDPEHDLLLLGQGIALAKGLAKRFATVGGIVGAIVDAARENLQLAAEEPPFAQGGRLAKSLGTKFPILQGPMTRVSDSARFCRAVADGGALPFAALALLGGAQAEKLVKETSELLGDSPWGVGLLGFMPLEVRQQQLELIRRYRPPFALIAGGRPDQARELEEQGIATFLHVTSPELLRLYLRQGARRFVFEGRECGGHVGPRTSFLLWEMAADVILEHLSSSREPQEITAVFAGGFHDAISSAMAAAAVAPLARRGVSVGLLLGTAYLFTEEATRSGAIVGRFQQAAQSCERTALLDCGAGHVIRCIGTPYVEQFQTEKRRLIEAGKSLDEIRNTLEEMNAGRLRIASKGVERRTIEGAARLSEVSEEVQFERGMYMVGDVATLRAGIGTIAELHDQVSVAGTALVKALGTSAPARKGARRPASSIAVIGMSCFLPGSGTVGGYWRNVLEGHRFITEVPESHWTWQCYFDPERPHTDATKSKWGGFLDEIPFEPVRYGIAPNSIPSIEPLQLMLLEAVHSALADAGYDERPFNRDRTAAILGMGGSSPLASLYVVRSYLPLLENDGDRSPALSEFFEKLRRAMPDWTEDSFPGTLPNVGAGRVANRFDFGGPNYMIDAACASSLAAVSAGVRELESGESDMAVVMAADSFQTPYAYLSFDNTHALSPRGRCSPFDAAADGIVISEGVVVAVLKRLEEAERDGDRIYAVLKSVASSSDGRDKGLTCPNADGQTLALERAYSREGLSASQLGLVEAHGTGTSVGDRTEAQALISVLGAAGAPESSCALGSVKSMIGHTKCAAGLAGMVKVAMALHTKTLPPTLVEEPNESLGLKGSPLYLNRRARPWLHGQDHPRTAGVSAFGFGGTNFHAVLEEYSGAYLKRPALNRRDWPTELFTWRASTAERLTQLAGAFADELGHARRADLAGLAAALWKAAARAPEGPALAIVAGSPEELAQRLGAALTRIGEGAAEIADPQGIYFEREPGRRTGKIAFLFPGQGSQYPGMLADLAMSFDEVRQALDRAEHALRGRLQGSLGRLLFPPEPLDGDENEAIRQRMASPELAQIAVGATSLAMLRLLEGLGLEADFLAGLSYGEYVALTAAGALPEAELFPLSLRRGQIIREAAAAHPGIMAAVDADVETVARITEEMSDVTIANLNAPNQTVIAGPATAVEDAMGRFKAAGIGSALVPVPVAFHTPLLASAQQPLAEALSSCSFTSPGCTVFSNTTAGPYPAEPDAIAAQLAQHLVSPVKFQAEIEAMYAAGARTFVEVGPAAVLSGLVGRILSGEHLALPSDVKGRPGLIQLQHLLGRLLVGGVPLRLDRLFDGVPGPDLAALARAQPEREQAGIWLVNAARSRPAKGESKPLLGQFSGAASLAAASEPGTAPDQLPDGPSQRPARVSQSNGGNGAKPPADRPGPNASASYDEMTRAVLGFQDLMSKFLDTQRAVLASYFQTGQPMPAEVGAWPSQDLFEGLASIRPVMTKAEPPASGEGPGKVQVEETPPAKEEAPPVADTDPPQTLEALLKDLVSRRTGYAPDVLDPGLDLEADLGIDSIKRAEILGNLSERLSGLGAGMAEADPEALSKLKTIRAIVDYLEGLAGDNTAPAAAEPPPASPPRTNGARKGNGLAQPDGGFDIARQTISLIDAPLNGSINGRAPTDGVVVLTADANGLWQPLSAALRAGGYRTAIVQDSRRKNGHAIEQAAAADLSDSGAVEELFRRIRDENGPIAGVVHAAPLEPAADRDRWAARSLHEIKSLYCLARHAQQDLCKEGANGFFLALTSLGGGFGFTNIPANGGFFPGHGGVSGFLKCLATEWPGVIVRSIDLDTSLPSDKLGALIAAELTQPGGPAEIGHVAGRRVSWRAVDTPLDRKVAGLSLEPGCTILAPGGARGITAESLIELARRFRPNLVVAGRTELRRNGPDHDLRKLKDGAEIKSALIERIRAEGGAVDIAAVEDRYRRFCRERELLANIARLEAAGAKVHYRTVDVCAPEAFTSLVQDLNREFGGIDGVVYGAGVIDDKLLGDKTPQSVERIVSTKVGGALALLDRLDLERLKFCVFFGSIAARYGNRGQTDYAAANEVLAKLALDLDRNWPGRIVTIDWGPWSQIGMTAELEQHLAARGIHAISPQVGASGFVDELLFGAKGESEVILANGAEHLAEPSPQDD